MGRWIDQIREIDTFYVAVVAFMVLWKRRIFALLTLIGAVRRVYSFMKGDFMGGQYGVSAILAIAAFGLDIGYGIQASLSDDGKISPSDFPKFMPAVMDVPNLISALPNISKEFVELDEEDLFKVRDYILEKASHIPGVTDKWLDIAKGAFKVGAGLLEIMAAMKPVKSADKSAEA